MSRLARVVIPDYPYHVTHRGNRRSDVFFSPQDRDTYRKWLAEYAARFGLDIWAYCLMTNHVHLLVVPRRSDSMARGIGRAHYRYAQWINWKQGWAGHLWANRYYSTVLDSVCLWAAVRYIETNPVRAGMAGRAEEYAWSSARAHGLGEKDDLLAEGRPFGRRAEEWTARREATDRENRGTGTGQKATVASPRFSLDPRHSPATPEMDPKRGVATDVRSSNVGCPLHESGPSPALPVPDWLLDAPPLAMSDWSVWLAEGLDDEMIARLRSNTSTGRPCGSAAFVQALEEMLGRTLVPQRVGRKKKEAIGD